MLKLKELRLKSKFSQQAVASQLGITQQAYANYESGKREPDNESLIALANIFGVSVGYLLGQEEMQNASQQRLITDDDLKFALFGDANVSDEVFEEVRRFAKFAKEQRENKND